MTVQELIDRLLKTPREFEVVFPDRLKLLSVSVERPDKLVVLSDRNEDAEVEYIATSGRLGSAKRGHG
jgi:hypothetical protein